MLLVCILALFARAAGIKARASHLPAAVARFLSIVAAPIHPGMARVMRLMSLPDDAFDDPKSGSYPEA